MPIPKINTLLLPVLLITRDRTEHSVEEVRKRMALQFDLTRSEMARKPRKATTTTFINNVAWALAYLVMANAITYISNGVYQIADRGIGLLKNKPSALTISELRQYFE